MSQVHRGRPVARRRCGRIALLGALALGCDAREVDLTPPEARDAAVDASSADTAGDVCAPNPCVVLHQTHCTDVDGHAVCDCDAGYHADGGGCVPDDDHGDIYPTGTPIQANGQLWSGVIDAGGDVDWFVVAGAVGRIYEMDAAGAASLEATVTANGGAPDLVSGLSARWKAVTAGPYGIRVELPGSATGGYTVQVIDRGFDDYADDLGEASATIDRSLGATIDGQLQFPGDVDWIPYAVTAGHHYQVELGAAVAGAAAVVRADDGAVLAPGANPYVTATTGRLFVTVSDPADAFVLYTVRVTEVP